MTVRKLNLRGSASQVVLVTAVILAAQAIGGIILARSLGPADRGILAALVLWAQTASDISGVGTPSTVSYWAASGIPRHGLQILRRALPWMGMAAMVIYFGILLLSGRTDELPLLGVLVMASWAVGQLVHLPLQRYQQGLQNMNWFNGMRTIAELGPAFGYATFAILGLLTVATGAASIAGMMFASLIVGMALARRSPKQDRPTPVDAAERKRFWSYSGRSWMSVLATRSNSTIDLLILTMLAVPAEDIGFYAVATTSTGVIAVLGGSLGLDLFPKIAAIPEGGDGRPLLRKFIGINAVFSVVAAGVFYVVAGWLIPLVYGSDFSDAVGPARVLLLGVVATSISRVAAQGLAGMGHPGLQAIAQVFGAAVTFVGVMFVATRSLELVAAAATAGYVVTMVLELIFTWRTAREKYA